MAGLFALLPAVGALGAGAGTAAASAPFILGSGITAATIAGAGAGAGAGIGSTITTALGAIGAVAGVASPILSGIQQGRIADANAKILDQQGRERAVNASIEAERERRRNRLLLSRQESGMAEAGVLSGSSFDLLDANSVALELDALTVAYSGQNEARALQTRGAQSRHEGRAARTGGLLGGAGALPGAIDALNFE